MLRGKKPIALKIDAKCIWEETALEISGLRQKSRALEQPIAFEAKTKEAKKIALFLELESSPVCALYDEPTILKVCAKENEAEILEGKESIIKFSYKWIAWQKE